MQSQVCSFWGKVSYHSVKDEAKAVQNRSILISFTLLTMPFHDVLRKIASLFYKMSYMF